MTDSTKIYVIQSTSIKVRLGWIKKVEEMNTRYNQIFNVSYLFTQKEVKRDIYYLDSSNPN